MYEQVDISAMYDIGRRLNTGAEIVRQAKASLAIGFDRRAKTIGVTKRPETPASASNLRLDTRTRRRSSGLLGMAETIEETVKFPRIDAQRPRSACTEKQTEVASRRRRPLSLISTGVKTDRAFSCLRNNSSNRASSPSFRKQMRTPSGVSVADSGRWSLPLERSSSASLCGSYGSRADLLSADAKSLYGAASNLDSPRFNDEIQTRLASLRRLNVQNAQEKELDRWIEEFRDLLCNGCLQKRSNLRVLVLETLFGALDETKPQLAVRILALILSINVTGNALLRASKIIYSMASQLENHSSFNQDTFIESYCNTFSRLTIGDSTSMLFFAGSLEYFTADQILRRRLLDTSILGSLSDILALLRTHRQLRLPPDLVSKISIYTPCLSVIRNIAENASSMKSSFLRTNLVQHSVEIMSAHFDQEELIVQGIRAISKLSIDKDFCEQLVDAESDFFLCSVKWMRSFLNQEDVIVRLLFVLGNLLSTVERAQWFLFRTSDIIECLLSIFDYYLYLRRAVTRRLSTSTTNSVVEVFREDEPSFAIVEDVLVKLARVIANLSVHNAAGSILCQNERLINYCREVLESAFERGESATEELVLNVLVALHNLSYYTTNYSAWHIEERLGEAIFALLTTGNIENDCTVETCSLISNLTRDPGVGVWALQKRVHLILASFVNDSRNLELLTAAAGTLINLSCVNDQCDELIRDGILSKVFELLLYSIKNYNWYLASLAGQIFYNLLLSDSKLLLDDSHSATIREIANLIVLNTDDSVDATPKDITDKELVKQMRQVWECEFCSVSTNLLEKLETLLR